MKFSVKSLRVKHVIFFESSQLCTCLHLCGAEIWHQGACSMWDALAGNHEFAEVREAGHQKPSCCKIPSCSEAGSVVCQVWGGMSFDYYYFLSCFIQIYCTFSPLWVCSCWLDLQSSDISEYRLGKCSGFDVELMKWTLEHQHASCWGMEAQRCLNIHMGLVSSIAPPFPSDGGSLLPLFAESAFPW